MIALNEETRQKIARCESAVRQSAVAHSIRPQRPLGEILADVQRTADLPLDEGTTLPPEVYTSGEFHQWEIDHIFKPEWLCLGHVSQIPHPGDFLNLDLLGEPLIVVRGKDGGIRVLSRVCPHRGMDIMPPGFGRNGDGPAERSGPDRGHTRLFLCPYHAWTFELDGRLKACPEMHRATGFARDEFGLMEFRSEVWQGFVFVNLDGQARPLAERLAAMAADFGDWDAGSMKLVIEHAWDCPFNWKVLVENFMESYHHLGAHARTLQTMMPARDTWNEQEREGYVRAHLPFKESLVEESARVAGEGGHPFGFPTIAGFPEAKMKGSGLFLIHPNHLMFVLPDRVVWYRIEPLGPHRLRLHTCVLVPESTTRHPEFERMLASETKMLIDFHLEDMEMCTAVQRGMHALGAQRGRLSHLEMSVWLIQRYLAARARDTWPALDRTAAPSQR